MITPCFLPRRYENYLVQPFWRVLSNVHIVVWVSPFSLDKAFAVFFVFPVVWGCHPFSGKSTKRAGGSCSAVPRPASEDLSLSLVDKRHVCPYCEKSFQFRNDYLGHLNSKHFNLRPYVCKFCSKSFPYSQSLRRHMLTLHEIRGIPTWKLTFSLLEGNCNQLFLLKNSCVCFIYYWMTGKPP